MSTVITQVDFLDGLFPKPLNPKLHGLPDYELSNPKLVVQDYMKFTWEPIYPEYNRINFLIKRYDQEERAEHRIEAHKRIGSFRARLGENYPESQAQIRLKLKKRRQPQRYELGDDDDLTPSNVVPGQKLKPHPRNVPVFNWIVERISKDNDGPKRRAFLLKLRSDPFEVQRDIKKNLRMLCETAIKETGSGGISHSHLELFPRQILEHLKRHLEKDLAELDQISQSS